MESFKAQGNILSNVNQPNYSKQGGNILISYPLFRDAAIGNDDGTWCRFCKLYDLSLE